MDDSRYFIKFNLQYSDMTANIYYNILQTQWSYVLNNGGKNVSQKPKVYCIFISHIQVLVI